MTTRYHTIIFVHDYQDESLAELMQNSGPEEIAGYLAQWDCGEYHDDPVEQPWGSQDLTYDVGGYVLSMNYGLGYAALQIAEEGVRS